MVDNRISVTLITRNRPGFVFTCLSSLLAQTYKEWDLVIVDSSDPPINAYVEYKFLASLIEHYGHHVTEIPDQSLGITQAWQAGMMASNHEFQLRLEDDVWLEPTYIERLHNVIIRDRNIAAVAGSNPNILKEYGATKELSETPNIIMVTNAGLLPIDGQGTICDIDRTFSVCHLHGLFLYRKSLVQEVGGFATHMSRVGHRDETDLTLRLYFAGYDLLFYPLARLWHCEAPHGGARDVLTPDERARLQIRDEEMFQHRLAEWIDKDPERLRFGKIEPFVLGERKKQ